MYRVYRARQLGLVPLIVFLGLAQLAWASPRLTYPATTSETSASGISSGGPGIGSGMVWISGSSSPVMALATQGTGALAVDSSSAEQNGKSAGDGQTASTVSSGTAARGTDSSSGLVDSVSSLPSEGISATASEPHASSAQTSSGGALSISDVRGSTSTGRSAVLAGRSADAANHTERSRIGSTQPSPTFASSAAGGTTGASGAGSPFVASSAASLTGSNGMGNTASLASSAGTSGQGSFAGYAGSPLIAQASTGSSGSIQPPGVTAAQNLVAPPNGQQFAATTASAPAPPRRRRPRRV